MGKLKVKYKFGGRKSDWKIVDDIPMFPNGGRAPLEISDPRKFKIRQQAYSDSTALFNMGEWSYNQFKDITKRNKTTSQEAKNYSNFYQKLREETGEGFTEPHERLFRLNKEMPKGIFFSSNGIKDENGNTQYFSGERYKKPVQPVVYKPAAPIVKPSATPVKRVAVKKEVVNEPTLFGTFGNDITKWDTRLQETAPIMFQPKIEPTPTPQKDYVTIKTGSSYRNPETQVFEPKEFLIDKKTGKRITQPTFPKKQFGGNVKTESEWEII